MKTVHLQHIGERPAIEAKDLKPGMVTVWNGGVTEKIVAIEPSKTGKTLTATIETESGKTLTRKMAATRLVGLGDAPNREDINTCTETTTEGIYNQIKNEEEEETMSNTFESAGVTYTCNDTQTRFYTIDAEGKKTRIKRSHYEQAKAAYSVEAGQLLTDKPNPVDVEEPTTETSSEEQLAEYLTTKDEGIWQYITLRRPPMPGGIPAGAIEVGEFDSPVWVEGRGTAHGWATYDHELTEKEVSDYELVLYNQPLVAKADHDQQTDDAWEAEAEAERKAREDKIAADAKATEDAVNGIVTTLTEGKPEKAKKEGKTEKKPRKSKDVAHEHKDGEITITLTAKQVDFVLHLPDSCFWEKGLDSILWCDVLVDEIKGQFEGKPMTIGAMISTLCEKGLGIRTKDRLTDATTGKSRKGTTFQLTEKGKEVAKELGLH